MSDLEKVFSPQTIVVVGASQNPTKWGNILIKNTQTAGFPGNLYGVNPRLAGEQISGVSIYGSIRDIPSEVDLVVIGVAREHVVRSLEEATAKGAKAALIVTAGFKEIGEEGEALQNEIESLQKKTGMRVIGPNAFGLFNHKSGINLTPENSIPRGNIGLLTQSGNVAVNIFQEAKSRRLGIASYVGFGNQMDLSIGETLEYMACDSSVKVIGMYVEGIRNGEAFRRGLEECQKNHKRVIVLKAGRTSVGARTARTHTASLAGDYEVFRAVLEEKDALVAQTPEELMDLLECAIRLPAPLPTKVIVITDGGGNSVMATDELTDCGFKLSAISSKSWESLDKVLPLQSPRGVNPIDTAGGMDNHPEMLADCIDILTENKESGLIVVTGVFGGYRTLFGEAVGELELETSNRLIKQFREGCSMVVQSSYALSGEVSIERLRDSGIPVFHSQNRLIKSMSALLQPIHERPEENVTTASVKAQKPELLSARATRTLLSKWSIEMPPAILDSDEESLVKAARDMGYPVCVKVSDSHTIHKSDVGGVKLNLGDDVAARTAIREIRKAFGENVVLQVMPYYHPTVEMLVGVSNDPIFGAMVVIGRGGIWTELEHDVLIHSAPVKFDEAKNLVRRLRMYPLLDGYRGAPKLAVDELCDLLVKVSELAANETSLSLDINPVLIYEDKCVCVDVKVMTMEKTPV